MARRVTRLAPEGGDWSSDTTGRASSPVSERDDTPRDKTGLPSEIFITLNYTSITNCVGIYYGTVAVYRDLTRITVSDIKSEWI